jgi:glucokinase
MPESSLSLVADLGATNARFALVDSSGIRDVEILRGADYPSLEAAAAAYLARISPDRAPRRAAIAIAGPVVGQEFSLTNLAWSFSIEGVCAALGLDRLTVVNDFTALALALPHLTQGDLAQIGDGTPEPGGTMGVIGPGSGLGVSGVVSCGDGWVALAGEGGHVTMPAVTEREAQVLEHLHRRFHHVSAERVVSGMGLANLYETLAAIDGEDDIRPREPKEITERALAGNDPFCLEAVEMFCDMLGTVAGNLALTLGSTGGIFIAGGIVPKLGPFFERSRFRERFEAKGRMRPYLSRIPTYVVTHPLPAFIGLKSVLERQG